MKINTGDLEIPKLSQRFCNFTPPIVCVPHLVVSTLHVPLQLGHCLTMESIRLELTFFLGKPGNLI